MAKKLRVGQLDRFSAEFDVFVIASPIRALRSEDIAAVLDTIGNDPAGERAALIPRGDSQWWRVERPVGLRAAESEFALDAVDFAEVVAAAPHWRPTSPVTAVQRGDVLCLHFDHGIGDAHLMVELLAAVSQAAAGGGFVAPAPTATTKIPLFWVMANLLREPRRLLAGVRATAESRARKASAPQPDQVTDSISADAGPEPSRTFAAVVVRSPPNFLGSVADHRRLRGIKASLSSILTTAICSSMTLAGVDFGDEIEVVSDMRRFLPRSKTTLANFNVVVRVGMTAETTPGDLHDALAAELESASPFIHTLGWLTMLRVRGVLGRLQSLRRSSQVAGPTATARPVPTEPRNRQVVLSFSDLTKLPLNDKVDFADRDAIEFAVILPLGTPSHVTIALAALGSGQIHATATFDPGTIEPARIRRALEAALSPRSFPSVCG